MSDHADVLRALYTRLLDERPGAGSAAAPVTGAASG
jgi:hypothetical protein